jgi:alkanesulfonate monooxygenase SsuD/methylene tetrahydromethanopterin reductase-like flavin-dependent oxidoreductase (luciferase family)
MHPTLEKLRGGHAVIPIGTSADALVASGRELERLGFGSVWFNENRYSAMGMCSAAAATTSTIVLGTSVTVWTRSPVQAQWSAATVDHLSGGRFVLGLGSGPANRNQEWHGIPMERAGQRLREYLRGVRGAWESSPSQPYSQAGEILAISDYRRVTRPVQPSLPIVVGVVRPLATRVAGEEADGVLLDTNLSPAWIEQKILPALARGAASRGRQAGDYFVSAGMLVCVDSDRRQAIEWAKHRLVSHIEHAYYRELYAFGGFGAEAHASWEAFERGDMAAARDAISEEMVLAHAIAGTPDDAHRQLQPWLPLVNHVRFSLPLGSLGIDEISANWRQVIDTFPPDQSVYCG